MLKKLQNVTGNKQFHQLSQEEILNYFFFFFGGGQQTLQYSTVFLLITQNFFLFVLFVLIV